jgi:hypothetical protein
MPYLGGVDSVVDRCRPECGYDVAIECTELPYAFRTLLTTIPADVPYLRLPEATASRNGCVHVGLVWASGPWDPRRSIPLACFAPLGAIEGIRWTALQHGPAFKQVRAHGAAFRLNHAADPVNNEVLETARIISTLDLVITVDTMVAHLAGALAKPVWTLLAYDADWRWLRDRDDSPWYPTMRLFRQRRPGDWRDVLERVGNELRLFAR